MRNDKFQQILTGLKTGDAKVVARAISFVENETPGYEDVLQQLATSFPSKIIGITGAPGAGKSTLTDALVALLVQQQKRTAVICVDPSSPFHQGAILGDRIRMNRWYQQPLVYIRSLASRGNLGGLNPKIIEITEVLKAGSFDYIIIETVGVGQSEVEIAGLADVTLVVLTPAAGDDVQLMKAGLMEIADIYIINKSDIDGADQLAFHIASLQQHNGIANQPKAVIKTIASDGTGIDDLYTQIEKLLTGTANSEKKNRLLLERAYQLIQKQRMKDINKHQLAERLQRAALEPGFNLHSWIKKYEQNPG